MTGDTIINDPPSHHGRKREGGVPPGARVGLKCPTRGGLGVGGQPIPTRAEFLFKEIGIQHQRGSPRGVPPQITHRVGLKRGYGCLYESVRRNHFSLMFTYRVFSSVSRLQHSNSILSCLEFTRFYVFNRERVINRGSRRPLFGER